jgi:hypothetical protein
MISHTLWILFVRMYDFGNIERQQIRKTTSTVGQIDGPTLRPMLTKFKGTELEVMLSAQGYTDHQQETLTKFRNRVLQLQLYPPKEKITFCEQNIEENDSKQCPNESVKFISLKQFKTLGKNPKI